MEGENRISLARQRIIDELWRQIEEELAEECDFDGDVWDDKCYTEE